MAIPSKQIGWSTTDNLLWNISKQLERLIKVSGSPRATTTTSTTAISFPAGQISAATDAANACTLTLDTVVYLDLASGPAIAVGDIIFNDAGGTNPYDGSGPAYQRVESTDGQDWNVQVGVDGQIDSATLCA